MSNNDPTADIEGLNGPTVVNGKWLEETTLEAETMLTLSTVFKSRSSQPLYMIWIDGIAQCPNGVTNMDVKLNGASIFPTRPLRTNSVGSTALSMSGFVSCKNATPNADGLCDNSVAIELMWHADQSQTDNVVAPKISSVSISLLGVDTSATNTDGSGSTTNPGDDTPVLQL